MFDRPLLRHAAFNAVSCSAHCELSQGTCMCQHLVGSEKRKGDSSLC